MSTHFNSVHEPLVHCADDAVRRLSELGINSERLTAALDAGDVMARQADTFSPVMAAGTYRWMETVRKLREGLAIDGWQLSDERNSPRITDPKGEWAIVPVSGNSDTGREEGVPKTARPRGNTSARAVEVNRQLEFNIAVLLPDMGAEKASAVKTWFLLYHRTQEGELRAELSLPLRMSDGGMVEAWQERILLPSLDFAAAMDIPADAGDGDGVDFIITAR
ncbi:MAG: hypothetical protein FWD83_03360 [Promicromonosporaceae bacterium]|nr:hypothetical protein [Promicromonosporaceae bacterium]